MTAMSKVEVLRAACCIAGADQSIDDVELASLKQLAEDVGVGRASLEAMVLRSVEEPDFYKQQFRVLKEEPIESMKQLFSIAALDGKIDVEESKMLKHFAKQLGVEKEQLAEIVSATKTLLAQRRGS